MSRVLRYYFVYLYYDRDITLSMTPLREKMILS
nr:MAG TPA: hypothetical protein [Caudoviricetes sp.]